jgi:hypothetical protein
LNHEDLVNGLLVVATTNATLEEATYIRPTDNYLFHNRDLWPQVPLNNVSAMKEDHTEECLVKVIKWVLNKRNSFNKKEKSKAKSSRRRAYKKDEHPN